MGYLWRYTTHKFLAAWFAISTPGIASSDVACIGPSPPRKQTPAFDAAAWHARYRLLASGAGVMILSSLTYATLNKVGYQAQQTPVASPHQQPVLLLAVVIGSYAPKYLRIESSGYRPTRVKRYENKIRTT